MRDKVAVETVEVAVLTKAEQRSTVIRARPLRSLEQRFLFVLKRISLIKTIPLLDPTYVAVG